MEVRNAVYVQTMEQRTVYRL